MTGDGSPQHRLIMATHFLETLEDVPPTIAEKRTAVLTRLNALRVPGQVWGEDEIKQLGEDILWMYVESLLAVARTEKAA